MTGWGWVVVGYLLTGGAWTAYLLWTRPTRERR